MGRNDLLYAMIGIVGWPLSIRRRQTNLSDPSVLRLCVLKGFSYQHSVTMGLCKSVWPMICAVLGCGGIDAGVRHARLIGEARDLNMHAPHWTHHSSKRWLPMTIIVGVEPLQHDCRSLLPATSPLPTPHLPPFAEMMFGHFKAGYAYLH